MQINETVESVLKWKNFNLKPLGRVSAEQLAKDPPLKPVIADKGKFVLAEQTQSSSTENPVIKVPVKPQLPDGIKPLKTSQEKALMKPTFKPVLTQ